MKCNAADGLVTKPLMVTMKQVTLSREQINTYLKDFFFPFLLPDHPPYHFEITDKGQRNTITYLFLEGFKPLVLKGTRKKRKAVHMWEGSRHLRARGIKAPEIIYIDFNRRAFKKFGCYFVCEEKIEGKICGEMDNPMDFLPLAAEAFSRMHRIKRPQWGRPWAGKRFGFWGYLKGKIEEKLQLLSACNNLFSEKHSERYWNWFMSYKDTVSRCKSFSLSHCDPHMHNVLINDAKEVYLLDNESLRYLPLSIEFFKLQYHFFQDDAEKTGRWQEAYLSYLSDDEVEAFNSSKDFFNCYAALDFAQREAYNLSQLEDKTENYTPYPLSLERALDLMEEIITHAG